jgi:GGDEF domain-containing protein
MAKGLVRPVTDTTSSIGDTEGRHLSIALIDVKPTLSKGASLETILTKLAEIVKGGLRGADVLFHYERGELIALLAGTDSESATQIIRRIAERLQRDNADAKLLSIRIGIASTPADGLTIDSLITAAKMRRESLDNFTERRPSIH